MLSHFINSHYGRNYIASVATQQVGQANVNGTKLSLMPIPLPPRMEQQKIVETIQSLFSFTDRIEKAVEEAKRRVNKIDTSILTKAFHGELVPQDPNDEPVSIPLERIKSERKKKSGVTKFNEFRDNLKQMTLNWDDLK